MDMSRWAHLPRTEPLNPPRIVKPKKSLTRDLRALHALPPYDESSNTSAHDGYFSKDIERRYGDTIENLMKQTGLDKVMAEYAAMKKKFTPTNRR